MATILENRANISYSPGGSGAQQSASSNTASTLLVEPCSVSVTKTALSESYRAGDTVSYVIRIENTGSRALTGLSVADNLGGDTAPKPLSYVENSLNVYLNGSLVSATTTAGDVLTFGLDGTVAPGDVIIAVYSAETDASAQSVTNTVTVTASGEAVSCTVNQSASSTAVAEEYAQLSIYKNASSDSVTAGDSLTYTFTIMNSGNAEATNVVLTDTLPSVFTVQSVSVTNNGVATVYDSSEYTIDATTNTITLPNTSGTAITVPAATSTEPGITTVTIIGTVG